MELFKAFGGYISAGFVSLHCCFSLRSQVNRTSWWMMHYGGPTPKRHVAWCNSPNINFLDLGKLRGWAKHKRELEAKGNAPQPLVHKYIDKSGRRRYKGSRSLKSSESGVPISDESPETFVCRIEVYTLPFSWHIWYSSAIVFFDLWSEFKHIHPLTNWQCILRTSYHEDRFNFSGFTLQLLDGSWQTCGQNWPLRKRGCLRCQNGSLLQLRLLMLFHLVMFGRMPTWHLFATGLEGERI